MTINKQIVKRSLILSVEDGKNTDGTTKYKTRTYSGIKAMLLWIASSRLALRWLG